MDSNDAGERTYPGSHVGGSLRMTRNSSLYDACQALFESYPLAVRAVDCSGTIRSMVLMLRDGEDAGFFVLSYNCGEGGPFYSLCPWRTRAIVDIEVDSGTAVPDVAVNAVTHGVPLPRHGSLFGWRSGNAVTALVAVYSKYTPECPEPCWVVMPLAGTPEAQWPPFTGEHLFGYWFWEHYRGRSIVSLSGLIAGTPDTVFWAETETVPDGDCCIVARDIWSPEEELTLRRGRYVYYQVLQAGVTVPSLRTLLDATGKIDMAPRFRRFEHSDGQLQCSS